MRLATLKSARRSALGLVAVCIASLGCNHISGRPGTGPAVLRPDEVLAFPTLYKENCAACHGENGKNGVAIPLANPVYLDVAEKTVCVRSSRMAFQVSSCRLSQRAQGAC